MTSIMTLDGPRHGRPAGQARELVVLLHGLGADGNDLIGLAPVFAQVLPDAAFVAPHAPYPCDMAPFGHQWFSFQHPDPHSLLGRARASAPLLEAFLVDELERHGLGEDRLALIGFSQGAMMALHVGLRRAAPCAAIVSYSGALLGPEVLAEELRSRPPVLLVHGEADEVVPFAALEATRAALAANGVAVRAQARPGLGHGIDEVGLSLGAALLQETLGNARPSS